MVSCYERHLFDAEYFREGSSRENIGSDYGLVEQDETNDFQNTVEGESRSCVLRCACAQKNKVNTI